MHIDTRTLDNNTTIEGDICIIGAGAAGISMALDLKGTPYKTILLESGGFEFEPELQKLNSGELSGQKYFPLQSTRLRYFGGTTGHWTGMCSPMDTLDFYTRDYVPYSGWPITRKDLVPFYERAQKTLQLGPFNYDYSYWKDDRPNLIAFPLDENTIRTKIWQINPSRFGGVYKDTIVNAQNIHLYTYASVINIKANEEVSTVNQIDITNHTGKRYKVKAKYFVMACGAIQNTRLLLVSNKQSKKGLGNDHDNLGRYFMEHVETKAGELRLFNTFKTDLYSWGKTKAEMALTEDAQRKNGVLNATVSLAPLNLSKQLKPLMETWQEEDPRKAMENADNRSFFSKLVRLKTKIWEPTAFSLDCNLEQSPNPNSRVTLSNEVDELGVPKPHLHWQLTSLDKYSIRKTIEVVGQQMGAAGLGRVRLNEFLRDDSDTSFPEIVNGGFHHMGTTRMHENPQKGVVDSNCKVHGISNLFVAGSSCFPTSGAVNPTLTLIALTHRLSDHLKQRLGSNTGV
ncbi:FAD-dependent oxidoreductase [Flagellimonas sp.]|uniref:FAD-dependent oxidoreductase n=1 Tax=Flagellimonas sp. TaxID=2058762 RepID=UPI003B5A7640